MTTATRLPTTPAAPSLARAYDWRDDGNCRTADPNVFFPEGRGGKVVEQTRRAKKVCARCPVVSECLEWALDTGQPSGVWGGLSEGERNALREAQKPEETASERCFSQQAWIEQQLAHGATQRRLAEDLGVSRGSLRRAIQAFDTERQQGVQA